MNKAILMGRLTSDPELRQTNNGANVCRFTVAINRNVAQGAEKQADFITVVAWNKTAEFVSRYFSKGKMILIEGNIKTGSYDDKHYPDVKHYTTEIWAERVFFTGDKGSQTDGNIQTNNTTPQTYNNASNSNYNFGDFEVIGDIDLPF